MLNQLNQTNKQFILMNVAERVKLARKSRHITIESMANFLGITAKQLHNYETGKCNLTIIRLLEIANFLNIEPLFFIQGLYSGKKFISNTDIRFICKLNTIKNKQIKQSLVKFLNELN